MSKLWEANPEYTATVDALVAAFLDTKAGQMVTWSALEAVIGSTHREHPGSYLVEKFRKRVFEERQLRLVAIPGVGLKFPTRRAMVVDYVNMRLRKAWRQENRLVRDLRAQPMEELTQHEKRYKVIAEAGAQMARRVARQGMNAVRTAVRPTETNPRRNIEGDE